MIPVLIAFAEFLGIIILATYFLADNDRIYASIFAGILSSLLSFLLGYQLLFKLIQSEFVTGGEESSVLYFQDYPTGYFFMMVGIMLGILIVAIVADTVIKNREAKGI